MLSHEQRLIRYGHPAYWVCQCVGWFGSAVGEIIVSSLHSQPTTLEIWFTLLGASLGVLITHMLRILISRQNWFIWSSRKQLLWSIIICLPAAALYALCFLPLVWECNAFNLKTSDQLAVVFATLFWTYSALLVWCGFYFGWHYLQTYQKTVIERARLDVALKEAELRALRAQINPHFLFNALNSVRALADTNPARAREAVTLLANLLRASLNSSNHEIVPLNRELETVKDYLALERIRFEDRLRVSFEIQPGTGEMSVPPLCLQTLVENAVKHGIAPSVSGGTINVTAQRVEDVFFLRVVNSPGRLNAPSDSTGLGLRNLSERVRLLFGEAAGVHLFAEEKHRVVAELRLPIKPQVSE